MMAGLGLAAAMLLGGAQASAQGLSPTAYAVGDGSPNSITLAPINVTATVGGRCGFATGGAPNGNFVEPNIDTTAWSEQAAFTLECTGPSRVAVVSSNGGLKNAAAVSAAGYTALAPYNVALNLVGATTTATGSCTAETLKTGAAAPCAFNGTASQTLGLRLASPSMNLAGTYIQVSAPAYTYAGSALIDGTYTDTLTITVAAAP